MTMHEKIQLRTPSRGDPLAAEARQLAIRAKRTSAYATDGSFRYSVNQVLAQTQHIADRAVDELLDELSERPVRALEEQAEQKRIARKRSPSMWFYVLLPIFFLLVVAALIGVVRFAAGCAAYGACHL